MNLPKSVPAGMTSTRFKHSRAALLLWTILAVAIGYGFALVSLP